MFALSETTAQCKDDHVIEVAIVRFDHEKILEEWSFGKSRAHPAFPRTHESRMKW